MVRGASARQVVYIENTPMFVAFAKLASFGLQNDAGVIHETS
jgi:hypothetical protein